MWIDAIALASVAVLLTATVIANVPRVSKVVRDRDPLGLVPAWSFFAPNPGVADPIIVVRDYLDDGTITTWRIVWKERYSDGRGLWRPSKRVGKLVGDCSSLLAVGDNAASQQLTLAFLLVGRMAERAPHDVRARAYEFGLVEVRGHWSPERTINLSFVSGRLGLPSAASSAERAFETARTRG